MVKRGYIPDRGDIVWISLDPTHGHEQKGRRPVLVLTPKQYNKISGLVLGCPITSSVKGYPYEVAVGQKGVVLSDQIKSLAWKEREAEFIVAVSEDILIEVMNKVETLLDL